MKTYARCPLCGSDLGVHWYLGELFLGCTDGPPTGQGCFMAIAFAAPQMESLRPRRRAGATP